MNNGLISKGCNEKITCSTDSGARPGVVPQAQFGVKL